MTMTAEREAASPPHDPDPDELVEQAVQSVLDELENDPSGDRDAVRRALAALERGGFGDLAAVHRGVLAALEEDKAKQVRYAYWAKGGPDVNVRGNQLRAFLKEHGGTVGKSWVYDELAALSGRHDPAADTGPLPELPLTDEALARMDTEHASHAGPATDPSWSTAPLNGAQHPDRAAGIPGRHLEFPNHPMEGQSGIPPQRTEIPEQTTSTGPRTNHYPVYSPPPREFQPAETWVADVSDESVDHSSVSAESEPETLTAQDKQDKQELSPWVVGGCYLVALATLPVSVNTSWRFFERVMHITGTAELFGMAAVMEFALIMCGIGMATSVRRFGDPGAFRLIVWGICGFSGWTAWHMSASLGESVGRMILGPVLGAVMLHLALGLIRRTHHRRTSTLSRIARELRERALSRLGLADDERTAAQRSRDRAATRAVALTGPKRWWWKREARLQRDLLKAGIADDPIMRDKFLARLQVYRYADELTELHQDSPWTH